MDKETIIYNHLDAYIENKSDNAGITLLIFPANTQDSLFAIITTIYNYEDSEKFDDIVLYKYDTTNILVKNKPKDIFFRKFSSTHKTIKSLFNSEFYATYQNYFWIIYYFKGKIEVVESYNNLPPEIKL